MPAMPTDVLLQLLLALSTLRFVQAANDWSQPCFSGTCSYDLPITGNGPSGTLQIWGAEHAIADITPAGGWEILSCDPESSAQDIRLACRDSANSDGCAHLWNTPETASSADGTEQSAVGKIVRLPENCGASAFARIAQGWVSEDQSVPPSISRRLVRRNGEGMNVRSLRVDTDFASNDTASAKYGPIQFVVVGANVPGATAKGDVNVSTLNTEPHIVSSPEARQSISHRVTPQRRFYINLDPKTSQPLNFTRNINLLTEECEAPIGGSSSSSVGFSADINTDFHAVVALGVVAKGHLLPPEGPSFEEFGLTGTLNAGLDSSLILKAGISGTISKNTNLLDIPLKVPGLNFKDIVEIGPSLSIDAQIVAELDSDVEMTAGINYQVQQAKFTFPKGDNTQTGNFERSDTPLILTTRSLGAATGSVTAHLIPKISFGIKLGLIELDAAIFAEVDASATAEFRTGVTGPALTRTKAPRAKLPALRTTPAGQHHTQKAQLRGRNLIGRSYFGSSKSALDVVHALGRDEPNGKDSTKPSDQEGKQEARAVGGDGGCLDMSAQLDINVGATADFFGLFDGTTRVTVFSKELPLLQNCPSGVTRALERSEPKADVTVFPARTFECINQNSLGGPEELVHSIVPGVDLNIA